MGNLHKLCKSSVEKKKQIQFIIKTPSVTHPRLAKVKAALLISCKSHRKLFRSHAPVVIQRLPPSSEYNCIAVMGAKWGWKHKNGFRIVIPFASDFKSGDSVLKSQRLTIPELYPAAITSWPLPWETILNNHFNKNNCSRLSGNEIKTKSMNYLRPKQFGDLIIP